MNKLKELINKDETLQEATIFISLDGLSKTPITTKVISVARLLSLIDKLSGQLEPPGYKEPAETSEQGNIIKEELKEDDIIEITTGDEKGIKKVVALVDDFGRVWFKENCIGISYVKKCEPVSL